MVRPPLLPRKAAQALILVTALVAGGAVAAPADAAPAPAQHSERTVVTPSAHSAVTTAADAAAGTRAAVTVPLLNGDVVSLVWDGDGSPTVVLRSTVAGADGMLLRLDSGTTSFEVPAAALPYLGHGLDPELFEPADLAAAAAGAPAGDLPVTLSYLGARPALPGVTITSTAAGRATGYLTAAGAKKFGAALLRQFEADHANDSYGTDGLFADDLSISLAGSVGSAGITLARAADRPAGATAGASTAAPNDPTAPQYVMHTLTVHGTNLKGKPDTGDEIFVVSADNANRMGAGFTIYTASENEFYHGIAKYSVPDGRYWGFAVFYDGDLAKNKVTAFREPILTQFTVSGNTSASISERSATSELRLTTPRRSVTSEISFLYDRTGAHGPATGTGVITGIGGIPAYFSTASKRPSIGKVATYAQAIALADNSNTAPYVYNLVFENLSGKVPTLHYVVKPASLATVTARFYADAPDVGSEFAVGVWPGQPSAAEVDVAHTIAIPQQRTEYLTAGSPRVDWYVSFYQTGNLDSGETDTGRTFSPGEVTSLDLNNYALHTAPNSNDLPSASTSPMLVSASRAGDTLTLDMSPFDDNTPGYNGNGYVTMFDGKSVPTTGSYVLDQNGTMLASGTVTESEFGPTGGDFYKQVKLAPGADTISFTLNASRTGKLYTLSTATQTTWTWHSAAATRGKVPAGWACDWSESTEKFSGRTCTPQPLMTLEYDVANMNLTGTVPAGPQTVTVTVGHMALTPASKVTCLTAQVSFDGGTTWQPATVTGSGDTYKLAFTAPASGYVTTRVTAADAAGGQISEMITSAYATGPATSTASSAGTGVSPALTAALTKSDAPTAACPQEPAGDMRCYAILEPQPKADRALTADGATAATAPAGWGAKDIESAYRLPVSKNPRETVAVVDAYNTPDLAPYLATYRARYGLPPCTTASGCLRIVNQAGQAKPVKQSAVDTGWDLETTADVEMVSAACPRCRILVVEAKGVTTADFAAAENTAARLGAAVISNSYGETENGSDFLNADAYDHPGHTIVASAGDYGFGEANFPADLTSVTAAGGTELSRADNKRGWTERAWNTTFEEPGDFPAATSSACSAYVTKPAWQHDTHCAMRTVADVSAVAWNVAVYEKTYGGWTEVGGTSLAAPIIAGVYALAGNATTIKPGYEYAHASHLFNVTAGNDDVTTGTGAQCGYDYLCVAKKGYNAPTGLGTPDGTGAS